MVKRLFLLITTALFAVGVSAQNITGVVLDAVTGDSIPMAGVVYRSHHVMVAADRTGHFSIPRHNGWTLYFTAVGYKTQSVSVNAKTANRLTIRLKPDNKMLDDVVVKSKRSRYSRKDNPAVELMRRVIAQKKKTDLANNEFYQFYKYQKLTLAKNNVSPEEVAERRQNHDRDWLYDQVEVCNLNGKMILPLQVSETVTRNVYRKNPHSEKNIVLGQSSNGVANLVETAGNILDATIKDIFTDVDVYDDQIRLLRHPFTSPIGKDAIGFYRFYIVDTLKVGNDECIELSFVPNNQQDFGFRGSIFVLNDSSLHVRRVEMGIPKQSDVNFVDNMKIVQEYVKLPDGQWVLDTDDMIVEMMVNRMLPNAAVIRRTKLSDYSFTPIAKSTFRGKATTIIDADARMRNKDFWQKFRTVELTRSESSMGSFVDNISGLKGMKYILFGVRALMDNFVGTAVSDSVKSKFDIGPVNTIINRNIVDGYRMRLSGRTTASLNPHLFWQGYIARGFDSKKTYYSTELTYAFNRKANEPWEFPIRQLDFTTEYDIISPSDKFLTTNKDNFFTAFHVKGIDKLYFYNRQKLEFKYETLGGLATTIGLKTEAVEGAAAMTFYDMMGNHVRDVRTTEANIAFRYSPGEAYIHTKQRRYPINHDSSVYSISHTMGIDNFLGGRYRMNFTEASIYKRIWLNSWGKLNIYLSAGAQWNKVPFPLLIMPKTNLSWLSQQNTYTFQLMDNMEFLTDRYASWHVSWDMTGKLLNRVPLIRKLKWREYVCFRGMYGKLTDKNNPFLEKNANDNMLFRFPEGSGLLDNRPYMEMVFGVHNIFKIVEIDYVHRMTYRSRDTAIRNGFRFALNAQF